MTIAVEVLGDVEHDGRMLCRYADALARMDALTARPRSAADVLLAAEHPPTITTGRNGGRDAIHGRQVRGRDGGVVAVEVYDVARGGSVTYHAPGQLVIYPIVQLQSLEGPVGRGPIGDLPAMVRLLESAIIDVCRHFDLETHQRAGFSGVWCDPRTKLASIGLGVRSGWSFHGLALNIEPRLEGFDLITPCALDGVRMTSMQAELERRGTTAPSFDAVRTALLDALALRLVRRPS
jgi:lipoate-protein ligase B